MSRAILQACFPWLIALAALFLLAVILLRLTGGRFQWKRLTMLHRHQSGGVQSLAFVLTLPVLIMVLLFIVQVSQLMLGLIGVNYAAYASARSASVWVPAFVDDGADAHGNNTDFDAQNELPPGIVRNRDLEISPVAGNARFGRKHEKIWMAAVLACMPISPSRETPDAALGGLGQTRADEVLQELYRQFDPAYMTNSRLRDRLNNKLGYSLRNTWIELRYDDRNSEPVSGTSTYNPIGHPTVVYNPSEVGWQDPLTVTVYHDFALLPGTGRFLSYVLTNRSNRPRGNKENGIYKTTLWASATMTNEGIRSLRPYVHSRYP